MPFLPPIYCFVKEAVVTCSAMNPTKRIVNFTTMDLDCMDELHLGLLLIEASTGIEYENQVGGHACHQAKIEGYAIPVCAPFSKLRAYFTGPEHNGWCNNGIDAADADFVGQFLAAVNTITIVDRSRLDQAKEAWIPIIHGAEKGFLTWSNSD
jgi:hypothetical protein